MYKENALKNNSKFSNHNIASSQNQIRIIGWYVYSLFFELMISLDESNAIIASKLELIRINLGLFFYTYCVVVSEDKTFLYLICLIMSL